MGFMKKRFEQWAGMLSTAYPTASSPYWRSLPVRRMKSLLAGVFVSASVTGFALDLLQLPLPPLVGGFFWPVLLGGSAMGILLTRVRKIPILLIFIVVIAWLVGALSGLGWYGEGWLTYPISLMVAPSPIPQPMRVRILFDAIGIWLGVTLGFRLLLSFVTTEGLAAVRMQTELSLALGIQAKLVPTISLQTPGFEIYGKSVPSTEMGGDLIDVIESDGGLLVYVADISGHGLAAGQLMGMLKAALRTSLQYNREPAALLESVDRVLPAVKEPGMYATIALLSFDGSADCEYALAGHVPILHYRHDSRNTARLSMEQFPLGLIPGGRYGSQRISCSPNDLFLLLTDGITEVVNARDEEFGLSRIEALLIQRAERPLAEVWESVMAEVKQHGAQEDDQSLLLVRVRDVS